ncbi:hypothetical protein COE82_02945 [Bacillus wiedmannii]|uniref:Uncharacterized protein n=1 Tax=Bacillus wiedmannii TaxID=1890302 RepID=A0ABX5DMN7_9BACI|nr:hypothetical protein CN646_08445 [Bacillus wiedmannii]PEK62072.1 hypothetical protein CN595_10290 [Bacillus wiedmannii]PEL65750.1 hypothetical protein CN622_04910 [Bacillus wiedmannii]PEU22051.1 hypothetical protein CN526_25520 [Bacillus wiedmannii]PHB44332.1 hypothetical protein COE82_02945 [Bacillus wiedmannii]
MLFFEVIVQCVVTDACYAQVSRKKRVNVTGIVIAVTGGSLIWKGKLLVMYEFQQKDKCVKVIA